MNSSPLKSTLIFALLGFLRPAISVLILPVYLKYLSPSDYGVLALISVFSTSLALISNLRLDTAMRVKYFDYYHDQDLLIRYLKHIFSFVLLLAFGWLLLLSLIGPLLFDLIFAQESVEFFPLGLIACVGSLCGVCISPFFIFLRNRLDLSNYSKYTLINVVSTIILQLYLVTYWDAKVFGILVGGMVPNFLMLLYLIFRYKLIILTTAIDKQIIVSSLRFSVPLIPYVALELLISKGDRYFINAFLGLEQVGLYALLMTIVVLIDIVLNALDNALRPLLYDLFKKGIDQNRKKINTYFSLYVVFGIISLFGLYIIGNHLELFTNKPSYISIKKYFGFATICMIPLLYLRIFNLQLMYFGKSKEISLFIFYKTVLIMVLLMVFVPSFGLWGALIAILVSNVFSAIIFGVKAKGLLGDEVYDHKVYFFYPAYFVLCVTFLYWYQDWHATIIMAVQFVLVLIVSIWIYIKRNVKELIG